MRVLLSIVLAAGVVVWGCTLPDDSPSEPDPVPVRPVTGGPPPTEGPAPEPTPTPILGSPSTTPTPDPGEPEPEPSPDASPDPAPPPGSADCGSPSPPAVSRINVKVHLRGANAWTLDSTPLVGPNASYCAVIGFTDGRQYCPVRPEGHPDREACETSAVGTAVDTGRPGPTWRRAGSLCNAGNGCENHPDNQYFVKASANGTYTACARNGTCGEIQVDR